MDANMSRNPTNNIGTISPIDLMNVLDMATTVIAARIVAGPSLANTSTFQVGLFANLFDKLQDLMFSIPQMAEVINWRVERMRSGEIIAPVRTLRVVSKTAKIEVPISREMEVFLGKAYDVYHEIETSLAHMDVAVIAEDTIIEYKRAAFLLFGEAQSNVIDAQAK